MAQFNLKTLDGVTSYSIFSGVMLAVLITTHVNISETAILLSVLESIANILGQDTIMISIIGTLVTVIDLIVIYIYVRQIAEHRIVGVIVSGLGFFGALLLFTGEIQVMTIGAFMIMAGYGVIRFVKE